MARIICVKAPAVLRGILRLFCRKTGDKGKDRT